MSLNASRRALVLALLALGGCHRTVHFECATSGPDDDCDGVDDDCDGSIDEDAPSVEWCAHYVLPGIHELDGIDPELPTGDLAPLDDLVDGAEVVGLGRAVWRSGGFFQARDRVLRYLVQEHGFRAVALDTPWDPARAVTDFVREGGGTARAAVRAGLADELACTEHEAMVQWLRDWNEAHPDDPVVFFGTGINDPWVDDPALRAFLEITAPEVLVLWGDHLDQCHWRGWESGEAWTESGSPMLFDEEAYQVCGEGLRGVEAYLHEHESELVAATSVEALTLARLHLGGLDCWEEVFFQYPRDPDVAWEAMYASTYEVFTRLGALRAPGAPTVLLAANDVVMAHAEDMVASPWAVPNTGGALEDALGDAYVPIGLLAYWAAYDFVSIEGAAHLDPPTREDNLQVMLHELWVDYLLVDLEFPGAEEPWLAPDTSYTVGYESYGDEEALVPAEHYRALIFLDASGPMDAL